MQTTIAEEVAQEATESQIQQDATKKYAYWRLRLTYTLIIGYAAFYLVRQNFNIALPALLQETGYTKQDLGWAMTAFAIVYGICKFISGAMCDRSSARYFMPIGLIGAALCSIIMGFSNSLLCLGGMYVFNAWFQSMGWPSVTRSLTQWFGPKQLGTRWGIVNASHQIGSVLILMGGAWMVENHSWRHVFVVPGLVCLVVALFLWERLRDNPESLNLPPVEQFENLESKTKTTVAATEQANESFWQLCKVHILPNKRLWYVCWANFFVYIVRMGFFNWAPVLIKETRGVTITVAGFKNSVFEIAGLFGGLAIGWVTDRFFTTRRGACGAYMMLGLSGAIVWFFLSPTAGAIMDTFLWGLMGFLVYGPQTLTGLAGAEFGSKRAAAAATGLTGTMGYIGASLSGIGVGYISEHWGWDAALLGFVGCALIGAFLFWLTTLGHQQEANAS